MASVSFRNIEKSFGKTKIIHGISFDIADGEFVVVFVAARRVNDRRVLDDRIGAGGGVERNRENDG